MSIEKGASLGPYTIVEPIGAGGMGEVYRAQDPRIGRDVAVKILTPGIQHDPERLRRFSQEARAAGALNHPNLLTIHDIGIEGDSPYIVTELLEGETLRERLGKESTTGGSSDTRLSTRRVIDWGAQLANGLASAHEAGIVHRDLKPENIFITRDGRVKILDFGLAKLRGSFGASEDDATVARGTDPGTVMGTIAYMSPEQVRGQTLDHRSDIFSLGLILYEIASGRRAFQRDSQPETMTAILKEDPDDLAAVSPSTPPALVRLIDHCIEKNPEQRFQSARDLAFNLAAAGDLSGRQGSSSSLRGGGRRWILATTGVAGILIGFLAGRLLPIAQSPQDSASHAPLLQAVTFSGRDLEPAASPDGSMIAYSSDRDGISRIWIKQLSGGGELARTSGPDFAPRFSPDGSSLLFTRNGPAGTSALYKVSLLGGGERKLVDDAIAGDWSPDGRSLVFTRTESTDQSIRTAIVTASADGSSQKEIATVVGKTMGSPRWSPDGSAIALTDLSFGNYPHQPLIVSSDGSRENWLELPVDADTQSAIAWVDATRLIIGTIPTATNLVSGTGSMFLLHDLSSGRTRTLFFVPSPVQTVDLLTDGRLVFDTTPFRQNLLVSRLDGTAEKWMTRGTSVDRQPAWSPDGGELIFSSNMSGNLDLWIISMADGGLRRFTDDDADDYDPAFSPDGKSVLWSSRRVTGIYEIWMANSDGSGARQLSRDGFDAENPTMTPDAQWVVYNSYNPEKKGIWKIRPDGSEATHLARLDSELPEISPDGRYVSFHGVVANDLRVVRLSDGEMFSLGPLNGANANPVVSVGRSRWRPGTNTVVFTDIDDSGQFSLWEQPFVPGEDTRPRRRRLEGLDATRTTESFGFSPGGDQIVTSLIEQLNSVMTSGPLPELAPR